MKNFLLLLLTFNCFAQAPALQWQKNYGGNNGEFANKIIETSDGGYLIAGATASSDGDVIGFYGYYDFWILKLNALGEMQWQQTLGGNGDERAYSAVETGDGSFIIAGHSSLNEQEVTGNHGEYDYWVVKLSATGTLLWQKSYGGSGLDVAKCIVSTSDGFVIAGNTTSIDGDVGSSHSGTDFWIVKIDNNGTIIWQKTYGGSASDLAFYLQQTNDGGFIVAGNTNSNDGDIIGNHGDWDSWIIKLDATGILEWQKTFGGSYNDGVITIEQTQDNGYILGGYTQSHDGDVTGNNHTLNSWFVKTDAIGNIQWQKCLKYAGCENGGYIHQTSDNGYIIAGAKYYSGINDPIGIGAEDVYLGKLDSLGNLMWSKILGSPGADFAYDVIQAADNSFFVVGSIVNTQGPSWNSNLWVAKINAEQLSTIDFNSNKLIAYPNPATNQLNITTTYAIAIDKLTITDGAGKTVLIQQEKTNQINTENLAAGIYFIQAFSGENKYNAKFIKE